MDAIKAGAILIGLCFLGIEIGLLPGLATVGMGFGACVVFAGIRELWKDAQEAEENKKAHFRQLFQTCANQIDKK